LARNDKIAPGRAQQVRRVAKLAVLALVDDVKDAFNVSVIHLRSVLRRSRSMIVKPPAIRLTLNPWGLRNVHD
jgi:hypothetical protein